MEVVGVVVEQTHDVDDVRPVVVDRAVDDSDPHSPSRRETPVARVAPSPRRERAKKKNVVLRHLQMWMETLSNLAWNSNDDTGALSDSLTHP